MRIILSFWLFASFTSAAETFICGHHPERPNDRQCKAKIEVLELADRLEARLIDISLSEPWPLPNQCNSPLMIENRKMEG